MAANFEAIFLYEQRIPLPIPSLTGCGVLPAGEHDCSLAEVHAAYVTSARRVELWSRFSAFLAWVQGQPTPSALLIDGSFTSDKSAPNDIDVVFDLSGCPPRTIAHWLLAFASQRATIKNQFSVDFWVYFPGAPSDLRAFFAYVRPEEAIVRGMDANDRKGLIRVTL